MGLALLLRAYDAGRAAAAGEARDRPPSPDALARLQAAVGRTPQQGAAPARPAAETQAEKSRFGINSLINRMTGHGSETPQAAPRPARQQPPVQASRVPAESPEAEEDQIEIPAFLRRQAN
jgi:cell division protein FtsZ